MAGRDRGRPLACALVAAGLVAVGACSGPRTAGTGAAPAPGLHVSDEVGLADGTVVQVGVQIDPAAPDDVIVLRTGAAGARVDEAGVTARLTGPDAAAVDLPLVRMEPGHHHGVVEIPRAGRWRLDLALPGAAAAVPIEVASQQR